MKAFLGNSWKERISRILVGHTVNVIIALLFDNILYPRVMGAKGFLVGAPIMFFASMLLCLVSLKFYDWSGKDWLGIETIKEARELRNSKTSRLIARLFKNSQRAQLVILSLAQEPFLVTVFLREGAHQYGGMTNKDWKNFFISLFIGNGFWSVLCWSGIKIFVSLGAKLEVAIGFMNISLITFAIVCLIVGKISDKSKNNSDRTV